MNKDLIIGVVVSLFTHVGVLWGLRGHAREVEQAAPPAPTIEVLEIPEIEPPEPPEPEPGEETEEPPPEFAPPMATDVPTLVTINSFVQPLQPPPPPSTPTNAGMMTVPVRSAVPGGKMANLFDIRDLDEPLQATYQPTPKYPYEMKRLGTTGFVNLGFIIDTQGNVRDPYVISSSHPEFEAPSLEAVRKWRFRPNKKGGKIVNARATQMIPFKLSGNK